MGRSAMASMAGIATLLLLCTACRLALAITDGLVANGNFERGPAAWQLRGTRVVGAAAIPSWMASGPVEYIPSGRTQGAMLLVVPEGAHAVRLGSDAAVRQCLAGAARRGARYALTFSAARTCAQAERLNVSAAGQWAVLPVHTAYSSSGWDSYAWAWNAGDGDGADGEVEVEVAIHNPGVAEDPACGPLVDAVAVKALSPPRRSSKNLVKNGDFEEGPYVIPGTRCGVLVPPMAADGRSPLPGWTVASLKAVRYVDAGGFAVPRGRRAVELLAGQESAVAQVVRTVPGRRYALSFTVGDAGDACRGQLVVEAFAGRESVKVAYESAGTGGARRAVLPFRAAAARTRLVFLSSFYSTRSDDLSSLCGPVLDDVAVVSVRAHKRG
ncbi:hypothetical protein ACP4OV_009306 [Aristida adscensionis]